MKTFLVLWILAATVCANNIDDYYDYNEQQIGFQPDEDPPTFITTSQSFSVEVTDDITFPCDAKNIEESLPLMFVHITLKGERRMLYVGDMSLQPRGYKLTKSGNSFILSGVTRRHAGKYECRIETNPVTTRLVHTLNVQYPAKAMRISPEVQRVVKGSSVTLECKGHGNPKAAISWSKLEGHLPSGAQAEEGSSLTFENVDRHVEGTYICTAANGIGDPSSTKMKIEVEYPPEIIAEQATFHTDEGDEEKLLCIVHGRPKPIVHWTKDGVPVSPDHHLQEQDGAHRHTLTISQVRIQDFGNYSCIASNQFGEKQHTLQVTGVPKSPTITSSPSGGEMFAYTITWETESNSPITQYRLSHRKLKNNPNNHFKNSWHHRLYFPPTAPSALLVSKKTKGGISRSMSHTLNGLEPATDYEIFVAVENKFGWSEGSPVFHFHTRKERAIGQSSSGCHLTLPSGTLMAMMVVWALSRLS